MYIDTDQQETIRYHCTERSPIPADPMLRRLERVEADDTLKAALLELKLWHTEWLLYSQGHPRYTNSPIRQHHVYFLLLRIMDYLGKLENLRDSGRHLSYGSQQLLLEKKPPGHSC